MNVYPLIDGRVFAANHEVIVSQTHGTNCVRWEAKPRHLDLDESVKSGEYFLTLATTLDHIPDHPGLQQITRDLIYL